MEGVTLPRFFPTELSMQRDSFSAGYKGQNTCSKSKPSLMFVLVKRNSQWNENMQAWKSCLKCFWQDHCGTWTGITGCNFSPRETKCWLLKGFHAAMTGKAQEEEPDCQPLLCPGTHGSYQTLLLHLPSSILPITKCCACKTKFFSSSHERPFLTSQIKHFRPEVADYKSRRLLFTHKQLNNYQWGGRGSYNWNSVLKTGKRKACSKAHTSQWKSLHWLTSLALDQVDNRQSMPFLRQPWMLGLQKRPFIKDSSHGLIKETF